MRPVEVSDRAPWTVSQIQSTSKDGRSQPAMRTMVGELGTIVTQVIHRPAVFNDKERYPLGEVLGE